jgi:DOMON domain
MSIIKKAKCRSDFFEFILFFTFWSLYRLDVTGMDCTDMVIGASIDGLHRVRDYYTQDRSTPRLDEFYGGMQSLTAAVANETNGVTTIIFRKPIKGELFCTLLCISLILYSILNCLSNCYNRIYDLNEELSNIKNNNNNKIK